MLFLANPGHCKHGKVNQSRKISPWKQVTSYGDNMIDIGLDDGLSYVMRKAITWTSYDILSIGTVWTSFSQT